VAHLVEVQVDRQAMPSSNQTCEAGLALLVSRSYGMGIKFGFSFSVEMQHLRNDSRATWRPEHMVTGGKAVL
jgi:hypothetical protein